MRTIQDEKGWRLGKDGEWYSPYVDVNGRWEERTDIEWQEDETPVVAPAPSNAKPIKVRHDELVRTVRSLTDFVDNGLAVKIVQKPHIDTDSGMVCVHVKAKFMGKVVDTDDGKFQFHGAPVDNLAGFQSILADAIRRHNGIEVGK